MAHILINDGLHPTGIKMLEEAAHTLHTEKIAQEDLPTELPKFDGICVRSATKVRTDLIDQCPKLKFIGRGGVGLDNIDVDYAKSKGIAVLNTPAASSRSVAELAFGHLLSVARSIHLSNWQMPTEGHKEFKSLKKSYSKGIELEGKTLGIIGFGRIGQAAARIGLGMGMKVIGVKRSPGTNATIMCNIGGHEINCEVPLMSMDDMLAKADFITMHIPFSGKPVLGDSQFKKMKKGVIIANAARGGTIDEDALIEALNNGTVAGIGLDVYVNEPSPRQDLLNHPRISVTPHIGASTIEAQEKIGIELATKIIETLS